MPSTIEAAASRSSTRTASILRLRPSFSRASSSPWAASNSSDGFRPAIPSRSGLPPTTSTVITVVSPYESQSPITNHKSQITDSPSLDPDRRRSPRPRRLGDPDGGVEEEGVEAGTVGREVEGEVPIGQDADLLQGVCPRYSNARTALRDVGHSGRGVGVARASARLSTREGRGGRFPRDRDELKPPVGQRFPYETH